MNDDDFKAWSRRAADWGAAYRAALRDQPVRPVTEPGAVAATIPPRPPEQPEAMEAIFADFETLIAPHMTHWQHPRFFAYFPANAPPPSVIAEYLVSAMAAQCMLWQTSPAATELETVMMDWLRQALGLPEAFSGVIHDSASSATLVAVLTMRERALNWHGNTAGLAGGNALRVYCSHQVHSSVDRAIWVAGIGSDNLVRVDSSGPRYGMDTARLEAAIRRDQEAGLTPAGIIACVGGTSVGASDDVAAVCEIAGRYDLFTHVDAAWAGSAMICPEFRHYWNGVEQADAVVFNPHKWLGAQFDCSAYFVRDPDALVRTLAYQPEYLKTHGKDGVINYSEWSVPLGRRFRALKLWFLIRAYGLEGLRAKLREHVAWAQELAGMIGAEPDFEIVTPPMLSLFSFRYTGAAADRLDTVNQRLIDAINDDGRIYLTQTRIDDKFVLRFQAGSFDTTREDVMMAFDVIRETAAAL